MSTRTDSAASGEDLIRDRAARLFRFLAELASLRVKKVRDVATYESVFWFKDLPREREVHTQAWGEADDAEPWLRIDKPKRPTCPKVPSICNGWFDADAIEDFTTEPKLFDEPRSIVTAAEPSLTSSNDIARIFAEWTEYIRNHWKPWQAAMERWEQIQRTYRQLFAIYQEQERRGEQYELLVGIGTLLWMSPTGHRICRPVLTARASLSLHQQTNRLELTAPEDGTELLFEQDMLEPSEQPPKDTQTQLEAQARQVESLWEREAVLPILKAWFHSLPFAADGTFSEALDLSERASDAPQMAFAPLLILRKRRGRSVIQALLQIEKSLRDGVTVPHGLKRICDSTVKDHAPSSDTSSIELPEEALFPLPTNDDQQKILQRLGNRTGVLVQGPPGTGKSHTIVNLVCHFLALGKRVLVTSQTPRALRVLQDKFPAEVLPLVVSVLDEKGESSRNLERSVHGIVDAGNLPDYDSATLESKIAKTSNRRNQLRSELEQLRRRQREIREADTTRHTVSKTHYAGSLQQIAISVARDAERFTWFDDEISETASLPLNGGEVTELSRLLEEVGEQATELTRFAFPAAMRFPAVDEVVKAITEWSAAKTACERLGMVVRKESIRWLASRSEVSLRDMAESCTQWFHSYQRLNGRNDWTAGALSDVVGGKTATWRSLLNQSSKCIHAVHASDETVAEPVIECRASISDAQLLSDAESLLRHLKSGGGLGFWIFRAEVVQRTRYLWQETRCDGQLCDNSAALLRLIDRMRRLVILQQTEQEWPSEAIAVNSSTFRHRIAVLTDNLALLRELVGLDDLVARLRESLFVMPDGPPKLSDMASFTVFADDLKATAAVRKESETRREFDQLVGRLRAVGDVSNAHLTFLTLLNAASSADSEGYRRAFDRYLTVSGQHVSACRCLDLLRRLASTAPRLAQRLADSTLRTEVIAKLPDLEPAWEWRRAHAWLERYEAEHDVDDVSGRLRRAEAEILKLTSDLVAAKAWLGCQRQLTLHPEWLSHMIAWLKAVRKIGKGTGKHAESYRRDARKHLAECWPAIPAHVMPLYRVAEQFKFDHSEMFDVVIIDEASQTGPEGLLLSYIAKQCIVVGDDEQISPEEGFVDVAGVRQLIAKHIPDIPIAESLLPGTSLFDQADIRFGTRTTLQEHFRCMPEIIRFSNELSYPNTPLKPLRQYPTDRLTPLVARFITDGYREGTSERVINRSEAAVVARTLIECLEDPRYRAKSFGIICLQGHAQAQLIEQMILERIGPEPFKDPQRRLLCGDPYSFQGDERDIIFLSMVAASDGDSRNAALTQKKFIQRFNVAASRGRDQLWLFHSVRETDLHPACVRRRLVQFMTTPPELLAPTVDLDVVRHAATHAQRSNEAPPEPFDSWFEIDVFLTLVAAGFRVIPQFSVAGKRIDLVVEDKQRRIAVECDGDEWHGPDEYEADSHRQRQLERCGWQFIRIRASRFYSNRARASDELIQQLTLHRIQPWSPSSDATMNDALDVAEVCGADALAWLGENTTDVAEAGLSQLTVLDDEPSEVPDASAAAGVEFEQQLSLFESSVVREANTSDKTAIAKSALPTVSVMLPMSPSGGQTAKTSGAHSNAANTVASKQVSRDTDHDTHVLAALACLRDAREPLTAGQIRWRTGITEELWPTIEAILRDRILIRKSTEGRRARFELEAASEELLKTATCPKCGKCLTLRKVRFYNGERRFWGCTAHPGCKFTKDA